MRLAVVLFTSPPDHLNATPDLMLGESRVIVETAGDQGGTRGVTSDFGQSLGRIVPSLHWDQCILFLSLMPQNVLVALGYSSPLQAPPLCSYVFYLYMQVL